MRTVDVKIMSMAGDSEQDKTPSPTPSSNDCLPPSVVQVSREELRKFLKCKRVGNYLLGKTIGEGSFAKVKQGFHVLTGEKVAVKIIDKKQAMEDRYVSKNMRREAKILQMVRHPNVIQLLEVVETENRYYLVFDIAGGGDLMDYICYRKKLGEVEVRKFIRQIVSAVHYLHQGGIIHRDLKVENLILDEYYNIKIIDFGLSNTVCVPKAGERSTLREHCKTQCGSPAYAAPEILGHLTYGTKVDVWSIGVNMYAMLTGKLPYTAEPFNIITLYNKMVKGEMNPVPERLSAGCKDLMLRFLTFDPKERISIEEAIQHNWLKKGFDNPLVPLTFPSYLTPEELNKNILVHMTNKMQFKEQDVIEGVTNNKSNAASCVYHLVNKKLQRYINQHPTPKLPRRLIKSDSKDEPDYGPKKPRIEDTAGSGYSSSNKLVERIKTDSGQGMTTNSNAGSSQGSQGLRGRLASDKDGTELKGSVAIPDEADGALAIPEKETVHKSGAFNHMESIETEDDEIPDSEKGHDGIETVREKSDLDEAREPENRKTSKTYDNEVSVATPKLSEKQFSVDNDDNNNTLKATPDISGRDLNDGDSNSNNDEVFVKEEAKKSEIIVIRQTAGRKDSGTRPTVSAINAKVIAIPLSPPLKALVQPRLAKTLMERKGSLPSSVQRERTLSSPVGNQDNKYDSSPFAFIGRRGSLPSRTYPVTRDPSPIRKPRQPTESITPKSSQPTVPIYGLVCQVTSVEKEAKSPGQESSEDAQLMLRSTHSPLSVHCSPKPSRRYSTPVNPTKDFYKAVLGFDSTDKLSPRKTTATATKSKDDSSVVIANRGDDGIRGDTVNKGEDDSSVIIANKGDDGVRGDTVNQGEYSDGQNNDEFNSNSVMSSSRPFASPARSRRYSTSSTSSDDSKRALTPRRNRMSLPITYREPLLPNLSLKLHTKHPPIEPLNLPPAPISPRRLSLDSYKAESEKEKDRSRRSRRRNTVIEPPRHQTRTHHDTRASRDQDDRKESRGQDGRKESRDHSDGKESRVKDGKKESRDRSDRRESRDYGETRESRARRVRRSIDFDSRISVEKVMNDSQRKSTDSRDTYGASRDRRESRDRRKSEQLRVSVVDSRNSKPSYARIRSRRQTTELDTRSPRNTSRTHVDAVKTRDHRSFSDTRDPQIRKIIAETLNESFDEEDKSRDKTTNESQVLEPRSLVTNRRSSVPVMITARVRHGETKMENGNDSGVKLSDSSSKSEEIVNSSLRENLTNQEPGGNVANQERGDYVTREVVVKQRKKCEPREVDFNENIREINERVEGKNYKENSMIRHNETQGHKEEFRVTETGSNEDNIHSERIANRRRARDRQRRHTVTLPRTQAEASPPVVTSTKYTVVSSPRIIRRSEV